MIALYMDEHVPSAITKGLRERSVDVMTLQDDGREGDEDPQLLDRSTELKRIVVTVDRDFYAITAGRQAAGKPFCGVILAPQTLSYRQRIDDLEMIAKCSEASEWADKLTILPLTR